MMTGLKIERISDTAQAPTYGSDKAACFDLRADLESFGSKVKGCSFLPNGNPDNSSLVLHVGDRALIPTGHIFHIPDGYQLKINPRSGLAWKHGITVLNAPATIDSDYKDELFVVLYNAGHEAFTINHGDRIAQAELMPVIRVDLESLGERKGGFGSSGVN